MSRTNSETDHFDRFLNEELSYIKIKAIYVLESAHASSRDFPDQALIDEINDSNTEELINLLKKVKEETSSRRLEAIIEQATAYQKKAKRLTKLHERYLTQRDKQLGSDLPTEEKEAQIKFEDAKKEISEKVKNYTDPKLTKDEKQELIDAIHRSQTRAELINCLIAPDKIQAKNVAQRAVGWTTDKLKFYDTCRAIAMNARPSEQEESDTKSAAPNAHEQNCRHAVSAAVDIIDQYLSQSERSPLNLRMAIALRTAILTLKTPILNGSHDRFLTEAIKYDKLAHPKSWSAENNEPSLPSDFHDMCKKVALCGQFIRSKKQRLDPDADTKSRGVSHRIDKIRKFKAHENFGLIRFQCLERLTVLKNSYVTDKHAKRATNVIEAVNRLEDKSNPHDFFFELLDTIENGLGPIWNRDSQFKDALVTCINALLPQLMRSDRDDYRERMNIPVTNSEFQQLQNQILDRIEKLTPETGEECKKIMKAYKKIYSIHDNDLNSLKDGIIALKKEAGGNLKDILEDAHKVIVTIISAGSTGTNTSDSPTGPRRKSLYTDDAAADEIELTDLRAADSSNAAPASNDGWRPGMFGLASNPGQPHLQDNPAATPTARSS